ncbi:MAG: hypothetical protein JW881_15760 [Spirochaetales bacterium]|nr:hypothetical protein [Spirochaetales bacterium]
MRTDNVYIRSLGYYIPEGRLTNDDVLHALEKANKGHMGKDDLRLLVYGTGKKFEFLGIRTRSFCPEESDDNSVSMARKAAVLALGDASLDRRDIDCVIVCGVTNPFREPPLSLAVAASLGMEPADYFDINDTCNGFMKSIDIASQYIRTGKYGNVLVVSSENPYELAAGLGIDYRLETVEEADVRFSGFIAGSGAAAAVISGQTGKRIVNTGEKKGTRQWDASILTVPGISVPGSSSGPGSPGMLTNARLIAAQVIKDIPVFFGRTLAEWKMKTEDFDLFVMHQLGNNVTFGTLDALKVPGSKAPVNTFSEYGNMGSANLPVNLAVARERGCIDKGDSVILISSACGLSYSFLHILW